MKNKTSLWDPYRFACLQLLRFGSSLGDWERFLTQTLKGTSYVAGSKPHMGMVPYNRYMHPCHSNFCFNTPTSPDCIQWTLVNQQLAASACAHGCLEDVGWKKIQGPAVQLHWRISFPNGPASSDDSWGRQFRQSRATSSNLQKRQDARCSRNHWGPKRYASNHP